MTDEAFLVDGVRTPIGRYGGALAPVRPDDLAAHAIRALVARHPQVDWSAHRRRRARLRQPGRRGQPQRRPDGAAARRPPPGGVRLDRQPAVRLGCRRRRPSRRRAVRAGEADLVVAGGVESMSRAPFVMAKAQSAWDRAVTVHDTTLGWRFVNPEMERALRHRLDGRDRRERRRRARHQPRRPGRLRAALAGADRAGPEGRPARARDRRRRGAATPRGRDRGRHRRAPARDEPRRARPAAACLPRGRLRSRRATRRGSTTVRPRCSSRRSGRSSGTPSSRCAGSKARRLQGWRRA